MKLEDFRKLEAGWAGHNSAAPDPGVIKKMEEIATLLVGLGEWEFVPIENGDGQLELHEQGWDIEIWVSKYRPRNENP